MKILIATGRLTREPTERETSTGNKMATINIACNNPDGSTDFFGFVAWGKQAEFILKYLHKGYAVLINADPKNNNYTRKDGTKEYKDQYIIRHIENLERKPTENTDGGEEYYPSDFDDETAVPF